MKRLFFLPLFCLSALILFPGCTKSHFMKSPPAQTDQERKERRMVLHEEFKKMKANEEIMLRTEQGDIGGRFLYYREGFVTLQTGTILRDYELSEIEGFAHTSKTNQKRWMIALMLLVAAYIVFEFTRATS